MSVRTYNPSVRVGNWNEDIQLEEDTLKDFLERRGRGELMYQKREKLAGTIFKKVDLSISRDGLAHFGDVVNLRCVGAKDRTKYFANIDPRDDAQLTVYPEVTKVLQSQKFEGPCQVSGAKDTSPSARSSFVIKSCDGTCDGEPLRYGQPFHISTMDGEGGSLLLMSDSKTLQKSDNKARQQGCTLVNDASFLTQWQVLHFNPLLRMEYEGIPVQANEKVIISHKKTNMNLCIEEEFLMRTPFGTKEYEISAHTCLDSHKAEKENNHWVIVMGTPGDSVFPNSAQGSRGASQEQTQQAAS